MSLAFSCWITYVTVSNSYSHAYFQLDNSVRFKQSRYVVKENQGKVVLELVLSNYPSSANLTVQINNENSENTSFCQTANSK